MEIVYILIVVFAAIAVYFLFFKGGEARPTEPTIAAPPPPAPLPPAPSPPPAAPAPAPAASTTPSTPPPPEDQTKPAAPAALGKREAPREMSAPPPPSARRGEAVEAPTPSPAPTSARPRLMGPADVEAMRKGLARSREAEGFFGKLKSLLTGSGEIRPEIAEQIEEVLLASDVGVSTTQSILERVRDGLKKGDLVDSGKVWRALRTEATRILDVGGKAGAFSLDAKPTIVLLVGVNGAGKTTTIGKLATKLKESGKTCLLAAGDTFRAAAVQQLIVWGERVGCEVTRGKDGADPSAVTFDAVKRGIELGVDVLLVDTAGRLHTKTNLMAEMQKIVKATTKALEGAPHEVLLVIDATNGQNALAQAKEFQAALPVTGIVLTKLDGTAKGGVILGISDALGLPVRFVGLGERPDDLHEFSASAFVEALLGKETEANAA